MEENQEKNRCGGSPTDASIAPRKRNSILPHLYRYVPNHPLSPTSATQLAGSEEDMACQPEPQSTNTLPSNDGTQEELQAREEAVQLALAKLSPYLYTSTYKTDFWERGESGNSSSSSDVIAKLKPAPQLHTSMRQDYQAPQIIASLKNKTTRYGYRKWTFAKGPVPATDNDRYRVPEYTKSQYMREYMDPKMR